MEQSAPKAVSGDSRMVSSVQERVVRFLRAKHPTGTAKRVSVDTMRATAGAGIPSTTVAQWWKRGSAPSPDHMDVLAQTYDLDFLAEVFPGVVGLAVAARRARTDRLAIALQAEQAETDRLLSIARGRA